jgi:putative transposase
MALSQSVVSELLEAFRAGEGVDLIRESVRLVMQELIETEATQQIGAGRYERAETRVTDRNGSRARLVATQAGDVRLRIPKLRKGSFFPAILEPRRRDRPGLVCGCDGGLRQRCLHPGGGRPGRRTRGRVRHLQI